MSVLFQIAAGTALLVLCGTIHITIAARMVDFLKARQNLRKSQQQKVLIWHMSAVVAVFVLSHTIQVYCWAIGVWALGALPGYEQPIYFALVTYTTLGYGDLTLSPDFRIFGAMASVTGILMFGLTTAFLVGVFARMMGTLDG